MNDTTDKQQTAAPKPDIAATRKALGVLFPSDSIIELRLIHKDRKWIDAGYFDPSHRGQLAETAARANAKGVVAYVAMNALSPQLIARASNRVQDWVKTTTSDADITRRTWLLLDFDPSRPRDTSSTDEQLELATEVATACRDYLREQGWAEPTGGMSGNGVHLLYPINLPNTEEIKLLLKAALETVGNQFDTDSIKLLDAKKTEPTCTQETGPTKCAPAGKYFASFS